MTKKPPKILTAAKTIAKNPKILDDEKITPSPPDNAAIIAALSSNDGEVFSFSSIYGFFAILLAAVNIFGGFLVTQRMLAMYKKKKKDK